MSINKNVFTPQDIVLEDDALHNKNGSSHIETFYYDAIFENDYSIVSLVNVFKIGYYGIVLTGMFIYKNAEIVKSKRERVLYHHLSGSNQEPHLILQNKDIIRITSTKTNQWNYIISMGDTLNGFNLKFQQTTTGWKGITPLGKWLAIPRFDVQGTLALDGQEIPVRGKGYHDHNIYPITTPFKIQGYHFGKITTDDIVITWARVMKKRGDEHLIVMINNDQNYNSIDPKNITFSLKKQTDTGRKHLPDVFELSAKNEHIDLEVTMETLNTQQIRMPGLRYWRSHLRTHGSIQIDAISKTINEIEISELLTFF